jgi:hypothetical protein
MNTQEATIEVLQNRIKYLEAHLQMAVQILGEMERDIRDSAQDVVTDQQRQFIDVVPTSEVKLPTFLNSRTWKHPHPDTANLRESRDRLVANAS